jgi:hypothetical protein
MTGKTTLLCDLRPEHVAHSPYAHLVADAALDEALYDRLAASFPPPERFVRGLDRVDSNQAIRIAAHRIVGNDEFSPEWQEFFRYHTSQSFWDDIVRVFGAAIRTAHPRLEETAGKPLADWRAKIRGTDGAGDVILDAQFVVNTPVTRMSSVRPAHVDNEDEIFAGLLYMRPDDDTTEGGDLALYRFKSHPAFGGHYAPLTAVSEEVAVAYAANRFAAFVNSASSIHGVTPRPPTQVYRRYINLIALTPFKAFKIPAMPLFDQLKFWLARRGTKSRGMRAAG